MSLFEDERFEFLNRSSLESLEFWLQTTGISLTQVNGQRKYGGPPPGYTGKPPIFGCEVFVSRFPRDVYEDKLLPLFQQVGILYEFRLMMNFSGQNRGFAYAKYTTPEAADAAVLLLNNYPLTKEYQISVVKSTEKRHLKLIDLPCNMEEKKLLNFLRSISPGVEKLYLNVAPQDNLKKTAVVEYVSHYAASMAKRVLSEGFLKRFDITIFVKWKRQNIQTEVSKDSSDLAKNETTSRPKLKKKLPPHVINCLENKLCPSLPSECPGSASTKNEPDQVALHQNPKPIGIDPVACLRELCFACNMKAPLYCTKLQFISPDGYQYFMFQVSIPGLLFPFTGTVAVLPGSLATVQKEVQAAAATFILGELGRHK
ncbi:dead end protein 1 [Erpetoichthys calabaricus]|uniref:DND microRNA-mediated repression inhibitor 1 n=1 Tax=Erpetoichthys calabaricus TaxID=27687 RepID=A0A8C4XAE5_ERPCA|nr:dead end protein 1 [Erpetoichthys calabaricus]